MTWHFLPCAPPWRRECRQNRCASSRTQTLVTGSTNEACRKALISQPGRLSTMPKHPMHRGQRCVNSCDSARDKSATDGYAPSLLGLLSDLTPGERIGTGGLSPTPG